LNEKILIVEDDQNIAKALSIRLEAAGYKVTVAPDTVTGVGAALKIQPDLALLDISMPVARADPFFGIASLEPDLSLLVDTSAPAGNGFTVAAKIPGAGRHRNSHHFPDREQTAGPASKSSNLGAADFFEKPYDAEELLAAIKRALCEARN
jgi:DNA-binding response OmpR family regulator